MPKQKEPTPQQVQFWNWYASPASPTYSNARQSALKAGYSDSYAKSTVHTTLIPYMKKQVGGLKKRNTTKQLQDIDEKSSFYDDLLAKAEENIRKDLDIPDNSDDKKLQIRQKSSHFTSERLGKAKWSTREQDEKAGLVAIPAATLGKLADTLANLSDNTPMQADYTIKEDAKPAELPDGDDV